MTTTYRNARPFTAHDSYCYAGATTSGGRHPFITQSPVTVTGVQYDGIADDFGIQLVGLDGEQTVTWTIGPRDGTEGSAAGHAYAVTLLGWLPDEVTADELRALGFRYERL